MAQWDRDSARFMERTLLVCGRPLYTNLTKYRILIVRKVSEFCPGNVSMSKMLADSVTARSACALR